MTITNEQLTEIRNHAGRHSDEKVPESEDEKLYFGMLEILDFQCVNYGEAPKGITEAQIKEYLLEHKEEVRKLKVIPSYMGLLCGTFNFLIEEAK